MAGKLERIKFAVHYYSRPSVHPKRGRFRCNDLPGSGDKPIAPQIWNLELSEQQGHLFIGLVVVLAVLSTPAVPSRSDKSCRHAFSLHPLGGKRSGKCFDPNCRPDAIDGDLLRDREAVSNPAAIRSAPPCGQCIQHQMRVFLQVLCADGRPARLRTVPSPRSTGRSHINHASTWSNVGEGSDSDCSKQRTPDLPTLERKLSWSAECPCRSSRVMEQGQAHRAKATSCVASRVNSVTRQDQA
jgi:hypothetical protein